MELGRVTRLDLNRAYFSIVNLREFDEYFTNKATFQPCSTKEVVLENGITVFGDEVQVNRIKALTEEFSDLFRDKGTTVNLERKNYLIVPLQPNYLDSKLSSRLY